MQSASSNLDHEEREQRGGDTRPRPGGAGAGARAKICSVPA